jgi:regulator of sigma E protease
MLTALIFLLVLAVLIFVHELGHFLIARWNGIRVDEFKIGFGPRLFSWGKGETKYGLNLIPFGGYVKIHGEDPDDESISGADKDRSFVNKKGWQQAAVLFAGVFFNFIFAWILYTIVFMVGVTADPTGFEQYSSNFKDKRIMVTDVTAGSPAAKAGLKTGDSVVGLGNVVSGIASTTTSSANYRLFEKIAVEDIQSYVNSSKGAPISVSIVRGAESPKLVSIVPMQGIVKDKYAIGIAMSEVVNIRFSFFSAIYEGAHYTLIMMRETVIGLYSFFANIFRGSANFSDVSGPIGIAGIVGDAAGMGLKYLLMVTALISINLGIINLIPFPALDGGRILFVAIEGIIRRRIAPKFSNIVNTVGFVLLMALMVVVTYKDIAKMFK